MSISELAAKEALLTPNPEALDGETEPAYQDELAPVPLLFFDGHCNLCNFFVTMFLSLDAGRDPVRVKLSSLQSPEARRSRTTPPTC